MWVIGIIILVVAMFFFKVGGTSFNSRSRAARNQWHEEEETWAQLDQDLDDFD